MIHFGIPHQFLQINIWRSQVLHMYNCWPLLCESLLCVCFRNRSDMCCRRDYVSGFVKSSVIQEGRWHFGSQVHSYNAKCSHFTRYSVVWKKNTNNLSHSKNLIKKCLLQFWCSIFLWDNKTKLKRGDDDNVRETKSLLLTTTPNEVFGK